MRRILLALGALTLLSGCGGGVDGSLLAAAVQNTEEAGGAEIAMQMTVRPPGGQEVVMTGSGVEDAKRQRGELTFQMPAPVGQMRMVQDGLTVYMRSDLFGSQLGGREWLKMDLERIGSGLGLDMDDIPAVQTASDQLRVLEATSDGVTEHGTETVRGVETTHYSATVDVSKIPNGERIEEISGLEDMPVDVWIDGDDRIRRVELEQRMRAAGLEMQMNMVAEYVRFGVPVEVDVPDDAEVFDATDLSVEQIQREHP